MFSVEESMLETRPISACAKFKPVDPKYLRDIPDIHVDLCYLYISVARILLYPSVAKNCF